MELSSLSRPMNARIETLIVEKSLPNERLDTFLRVRFAGVSRAAIQRLIEEGSVRIDGRLVKAPHHPRAGELVEIHWPQVKTAIARPEAIALDILFEDEEILVLNKPAGLVVHPSAGHDEHTLVNALLHHCAGNLSGIGGVARPGIVHRLDKETSGCLIVAKHDHAHLSLAQQFEKREVEKIYHALLCGQVSVRSGEIRAAIARHSSHRKRMAVTEGNGRAAWTSFRVLERLAEATLVEALLHSGRTHQIRVHFQHIGYPVIGDSIYGDRQNKRLTELSGCAAPRQMLHATKLTLNHPRSGIRMTFVAPWPDDFVSTLTELGGKAPTQPFPVEKMG